MYTATALLFVSGFAALVYQTAWLRELRLVFGASTAANAAVLAIFMGGLGAGGLLLGPRADRHPRPLALYGRLELGVTLAAALSPLLLDLVRAIYVALGGTVALGQTGGTVLRLALSTLVLGIPTVLMGGTLPAMVRAVERGEVAGRRSVGLLYGGNTIGAVAGVLWATFVSLEAVGIRATLWLAVAANLVIALLALYLGSRGPALEASAAPAEEEAAEAVTERPRKAPVGLVLASAAGVGFAFLLMELVWYRMLSPILGGSSYTFGMILACALLGIGAGGALFGARRGQPTLLGFAVTCTLEAVFVAAPYAMGDQIALLAAWLRPMGDASFGMLVGQWGLLAAVVVLPAALVSGYQLPLLVALLGDGSERVGREVGQAYAWNTAGAIVGSLAGGFGILPLLTAPVTWQAVALMLCALGGVAAAQALRLGARRAEVAGVAGLGVLAVALCLAEGPTAVWRHAPIGAGRFKLTGMDAAGVEDALRAQRRSITWEAEGIEAGVAIESKYGDAFVVNGKSDGHSVGDAPTFIWSGLMAALMHPDPRRAFVIGLGTGETAGWLGAVPELEEMDVVELEPIIAEVAHRSRSANRDVMDNPKMNLIFGDGREVLLTASGRYDLIVSNPSNPYRAGVASLFTKEFYQAASERLEEGGVFAQWLQGYDLSAATVRTTIATLQEVFPHIEIWELVSNGDMLMLATHAPLAHDLPRLTARLAADPYKPALAITAGLDGVEGLYAGYIANPELSRRLAAAEGSRINTDDWPRIEFDFARQVGAVPSFSLSRLRALAEQTGTHRPPIPEDAVHWGRVSELRVLRAMAEQRRPALNPLDGAAQQRWQARQAYLDGALADVLPRWRQQDAAPMGPMDLRMLAEAAAAVDDPQAPALIDALQQVSATEAEAVRARLAVARGDDAVPALTAALHRYRADPWAYGPLMQRTIALAGQLVARQPDAAEPLYEAFSVPFAIHGLEEYRLQALIDLSRRVDGGARCTDAIGQMEPHVPWDEELLFFRAACYARFGSPLAEAAAAELEALRASLPTPLDAGLDLSAP